MDIQPLHTDDDYRAALAEVSALVDLDPEPGTPNGDRLEILSILVEHYESSMDATAQLLRSPANVAHLERSIAQLRAGEARRGDWLSLADALAQLGEADFEFDAPRIPPATNIVTLGIASERAVAARFAAAMKGEAQGSFITFASPELLFQTLTEPRWYIVKAMTGAGPLSLREVAQRVGRDVEAVHDDVRALLDTGVLERASEGAIVFPYEAVHVDFTLTAPHD